MKRLCLFFAALTFCAVTMPLFAQPVTLRFKYKKDDNLRILGTVQEDVKYNGRLNHHATIVNRVTLHVDDVDEAGRGHYTGTFMTSESSTSRVSENFSWGEEFKSAYWRDSLGNYDISDDYFMPVVRDVPVFSEKPVSPGDTWTAAGYEAQDLRRTFGIAKPYKVPFTAEYEYVRDEEGEGADSSHAKKTFQVISCKYNLYYESPVPSRPQGDYPVATMGYSHRLIWWDNDKGMIDHAEESFRIVIETALGNTYDFSGTTREEVTEFVRTATEEAVREAQQKVQELGLENVEVKKSEKGLTLSIENIQFEADSAVLLSSEKEKLKKLSAIIAMYPDNDLLVSGHTAMAGTEKARQALSEERAGAVADFLVQLGVRDSYHIFTQGFGARIPIAPNSTEAGKAKNRRVEITILDK
ncbi:MAG: OmpA family protein [Treponema sp.]|nr:OmpA family protein [Treponema sp.]